MLTFFSSAELINSANSWFCRQKPLVSPFKWNLFDSTFAWQHLFYSILKNKLNIFLQLFCGALYGAKRAPSVKDSGSLDSEMFNSLQMTVVAMKTLSWK